MVKYLKAIIVFLWLSGLTSCEKLIFPDVQDDNIAVFDDIYRHANENYVFFDYKNIDWEAIYHTYRPLVSNDMSEEDFFELCSAFVHELRDSHSNIRNGNKVIWWSAQANYSKPNFNKKLLFETYLKNDYKVFGRLIATKMDDVGYVYIENFWYADEHEHFNELLTHFQDTRGLIIDVRNNGGGHNAAAKIIPGHFTTQRYAGEQWIYKNGKGWKDFSEPSWIFIEDVGAVKYLKPVIVLTNRGSYSTTNSFVNFMRYLPNVTLMGDTTGGGAGVPRPYMLANGWEFYTVDTFILDAEGNHMEMGIAPDIFVEMDENNPGVDEILERAIQELKYRDKSTCPNQKTSMIHN